MRKPNFFIIGAPKCGTTALAAYLSEHPGVFMSTPKEPHYFNTDHQHRGYENRDSYLRLFSGASIGQRAVGEASVWYLYSKTAIYNILRDIPNAKFVVMLRNPVDMAPSLHAQMLFSGYENVNSFERAWRLQTKRSQGRKIPYWCKEPLFLQYKNACSLGAQYEGLLEHVNKDRVLPILFDDFKSKPEDVWTDLQHFLDLHDDGRDSFPVVNSSKRRRWLALRYSTEIYSRIKRAFRIPDFRTGFLTALDRRNYETIPRRPLPAHFAQELKASFSRDIQKLSDLLDRNLAHWTH